MGAEKEREARRSWERKTPDTFERALLWALALFETKTFLEKKEQCGRSGPFGKLKKRISEGTLVYLPPFATVPPPDWSTSITEEKPRVTSSSSDSLPKML